MKKKIAIIVGAVGLASAMLFIQPVQSFAVSALSVFRVGETKTIQIALTDIEELYAFAKEHNPKVSGEEKGQLLNVNKHERPEIVSLNNINEFSGFKMRLPKELENEVPKLTMIDSQQMSASLNVDVLNDMLLRADLNQQLDSKYNGENVTITSPPILYAKYENVDLIATQGPVLESDEELNQTVWDMLLQVPGIPVNLRTQLAEIDIHSRDIYLPIIMGVGREVSIGDTKGYIYSGMEMEALMQTVPQELGIEEHNYSDSIQQSELTRDSVLIFTKNNSLFVLRGAMADEELVKIARSIRL